MTYEWTRYSLGALLAFGAINAFAGGWYGLSGAPGVPLEWLAGSPFTIYFIPSLVLFVVVGGALACAAIAVFARWRLAGHTALLAGIIVLSWMCAQVAIIGYVSWMQPATFAGRVLILVLTSLLPSSKPRTGNGS